MTRSHNSLKTRAPRELANSPQARLWRALCCLLVLATAPGLVPHSDAQATNLQVITADFNYDGIPDVLTLTQPAAGSTVPPTATIAFGAVPYGTFSKATAVSFPSTCASFGGSVAGSGQIIAADFNHDGLADIFFTCTTSTGGSLSALMVGFGDGTFNAPITLSQSPVTQSVIGDFNHDGKLDLALIQQVTTNGVSSTQVSMFAGTGGIGAATFAEPVITTFANTSAFDTSANPIQSVVAADVNGDGSTDLVAISLVGQAASGSYTASVFGSNQDGTFGVASQGLATPNTSVTLGSAPAINLAPFSLFSGNVFGGGKPDILIADTGTTPGVFLLQNTSSGSTFSLAPAVKSAYPGLQEIAVGNFTGTTFSDLVVADGSKLAVLANDGTGTFSSSYSTLTLPASSNPNFALADANSDGYTDIYIASLDTTGALKVNVNLVSGSSTATSQPFSLTVGSKAVSASWVGNVNLTGSTASGTQIVNGVTSAAAITSTANPSTIGQSITLTATVASAAGTTQVPTGVVTFMDGTSTLVSGELNSSGQISYTTDAFTQGPHSITATYAGDSFYAGTVSPAFSQVVNSKATTATILTWATPAPITFGTPLSSTQLDATAADPNGVTIPGIFTYTPAAGTILSPGNQTLSVSFVPTDLTKYLAATKSVVIDILPATAGTTLAITSGGDAVSTLTSGTAVTLTATVSSGSTPLQVGQVDFCNAAATTCTDVNLLGTAQLTSAGTAVLSLVPAIGTHSYKAVFLGTSSYTTTSSAAEPLAVTGKYTTSTTIAQSGNPGAYTLTATTVGTGSATTPPTGLISFIDQTNNKVTLASTALTAPQFAYNLSSLNPISTGREPKFVAVGDFNGDGKQDLAIADYGVIGTPATGRTLTILLGNGDGTFKAAASPAVGNAPYAIAVGDFNEDGKQDLAVTNSADNTVLILTGNGDGTFTAGATIDTGTSPFGIVTGDFNNDGHADLAIANNGSNTLTILQGNGDGTFTAAETSPATGTGPISLVVGDFDGDGKADLAVANTGTNGLTILLGNGDETFTAKSNGDSRDVAGGGFATVVLGDFNGDGKQDLVIAGENAQTQLTGSVLLGNGDGTFKNSSGLASDPTTSFSIAARDFNGDGKTDIIVADDNVTTILGSNGDGTFTPITYAPTGDGSTPDFLAIAVGDFNGDGIPDSVTANSNANSVSALLTQATQTATATVTGIAPSGLGAHQVVASYPGDASFTPSTSATTTLQGTNNAPAITWTPTVSTIVYGTALGAQQLDAVATGRNGVALTGVFTYTPAAGAVLAAGTQKLSVLFTPADTSYIPVTGTTNITITQAAPTLTWTTPAGIAYGTPLSATQLDAIVTGITSAALPGVFTYTPAAGTVLAPGTQTLNVSFAPTDAVDYSTAIGSVKLIVTGLTLTSITPNMARLGDPATSITLTGTGFVATSVAQVNGTAISTRLVSPTTLTAVIPASDLTATGSLQITVVDPDIDQISAAQIFTVIPASPSVTLGGPSTAAPGSQPTLTFALKNSYPVPLTATLTLAFAPAVSPAVDDPAVQFASGGRTLTFTIPANSTTVPPIRLQTGTVAGTITVPLVLTADGANVTPTTLQPVVITIPPAVPTISSSTLTRSGNQLTIVMKGFSNTREVSQAHFHFIGISGAQIATPDVTVPATTFFATWYNSTDSDQYGSTFTYTQIFNVSDGAANIESVEVTLTNSVGASVAQTTQ